MSKPTAPSAEPKPAKKTRVLSPEMKALRDEHNSKVAAFHATQKSAATLKAITEKLLPKLTTADAVSLYNALAPIVKASEINP